MKNWILLLSILCLAGCSGSRQVTSTDGNSYANDVTKMIEGKAAGVQFNSSSSNPEKQPSLLIRGINSINAGTDPLYVIDGMPYDGPINMINPYDIESVRVLKDPNETVIYGFRGANGVVLITTKKGGARKQGTTK